MANDLSLAENVNLLESNEYDEPKDLYGKMLEPINNAIQELIEESPDFIKLSKLHLDRNFIKRGIMTISYGVTPKGIANQLLEDHFKFSGKINNKSIYIPKNEDYNNIELYKNEINKLSEIIYNLLFKVHPLLDELINYFNNMVKLLNKFNLPIVWITSLGLYITQQYPNFIKYDIINSILSQRKKVTLRKSILNSINNVKQVNAFVPNFIYSLNAAYIALLFEKLSNSEYKNLFYFDILL
jgi:DNA-directed RNA polymerase